MANGVVRLIDKMGRIVIPKEYRKVLGIHSYDRLELVLKDTSIEVKKCSVEDSFLAKMNLYFPVLNDLYPNHAFFCDRDFIYSYHKKNPIKNHLFFKGINQVQFVSKSISLFSISSSGYFVLPFVNGGYVLILCDFTEEERIAVISKFLEN